MTLPTEIEITTVDEIDEATLQIRGCIPLLILNAAVEELKADNEYPNKELTLRQQAVSILLSEKVDEILSQRGLDPIGAPEVYLTELQNEKGIEFTLNVAIYPTPEIVGYEKFNIVIDSQMPKESDIKDVIAKMLTSYREEVKKPELELSDTVAAEMIPGVNDLQELHEYVRLEEQARCHALELEDVREQIFKYLVDLNDFVVPLPLIDDEIRGFLLAEGKVDSDLAKTQRRFSVEEFRAEYRERAEERARLTVIVDRISEKEDIYAEEEEIEEAIEEIASLHETTFEETHDYLMENGFILEVILAVTQEKVFEFLLERAVISRKGLYH